MYAASLHAPSLEKSQTNAASGVLNETSRRASSPGLKWMDSNIFSAIRRRGDYYCKPGYTCNEGSWYACESCTECAPGKFQQDTTGGENGVATCKECAAGRAQLLAGSAKCINCGAGKYSVKGSTNCFATPRPTPTPTFQAPTRAPTSFPTLAPTRAPTSVPTPGPTEAPTRAPTSFPTPVPTRAPTSLPTSVPTSVPTEAPTPAPTIAATVAPTATPTRPRPPPSIGGMAGGSTIPVSATGDPHMQNMLGQRFDLMQAGNHTLLQIPRIANVGDTLLRVQATAEHDGIACAEMYFKTLNISGEWANDRQRGGYTYTAETAEENVGWQPFGKVDLKVAWGRTSTGTTYLNFYVRHLKRAAQDVGGLLGMDDYRPAAKPSADCAGVVMLLESPTENTRESSVAAADM